MNYPVRDKVNCYFLTSGHAIWPHSAHVEFIRNAPVQGISKQVALSTGLLCTPENAAPAAIRLVEQSGAGWVDLAIVVDQSMLKQPLWKSIR